MGECVFACIWKVGLKFVWFWFCYACGLESHCWPILCDRLLLPACWSQTFAWSRRGRQLCFGYVSEGNFTNRVSDCTSKHHGGMCICMYLAKLGWTLFDFDFATPMVWNFIRDPSYVIVYCCKPVGLRRSLGAAEVISFSSPMFLKQFIKIK